MKMKTLILKLVSGVGKGPVRGVIMWVFFLLVIFNSLSVSVYSQDDVYWRSEIGRAHV